MANVLFRINQSTVPQYARPQRVKVHRPEPTVTNLLGEPGGAQGYPSVVMTWDRIPGRGIRWWEAFLGEGKQSVRLTYVAVPDPRATTSVTLSGTTYPNHARWNSGLLVRPIVDPGATVRWLTDPDGVERDYIEGAVTITISELGRRF